MGDLTIIILAAMLIMLCVVIMKINEKIDRYIMRFRKLERALVKNATGQVPLPDETPIPSAGNDIPVATKSSELRPDRQIVAKSGQR